MIVQWCLKGMSLPDDDVARGILMGSDGLLCNAWRHRGPLTPEEIRHGLVPRTLDLHVNHFDEVHETTPFISLTAGTVERDAQARANRVHSALEVALRFGTDFGRRDVAYVFTCWVVLAPRAAVEIEGVAEEVRDLTTYRSYSAYQVEGEIVAKVRVPANQLLACEKWEASDGLFKPSWREENPGFIRPETLSNVREVLS